MGVWIETADVLSLRKTSASHPAWVCGLKLDRYDSDIKQEGVTPCVGVWIETSVADVACLAKIVTPCVGVWIETNNL